MYIVKVGCNWEWVLKYPLVSEGGQLVEKVTATQC